MHDNPLHAMLAEHMPGIPAQDIARFAASLTVDEPYVAPVVAPSIPAGRVTQARHCSSAVYPGVERGYALYVPQQHEEGTEAALMVFQDGARYLGPEANAARVLDALIDDGSMPVTIALFVESGERGPGLPAGARLAASAPADSAPSTPPGNGRTPLARC